MPDFETWALERARRYLGVSVLSEPTSAGPVVEIDDISAAAVRDFPSSNATALLIIVIKELIQSDLGNESHEAVIAPNTEEEGTPAEENAGEEADVTAEPHVAAGAEPAITADDDEAAPVVAAGPEEGEEVGTAMDASAPLAPLEAAQTETEGANILDETNTTEMNEAAVLPAQIEVTRLIARLLPPSDVQAQIRADDWIVAAYFVKSVDAADSAPFDVRFQCGVLPISSITKLSQVITKACIFFAHFQDMWSNSHKRTPTIEYVPSSIHACIHTSICQ